MSLTEEDSKLVKELAKSIIQRTRSFRGNTMFIKPPDPRCIVLSVKGKYFKDLVVTLQNKRIFWYTSIVLENLKKLADQQNIPEEFKTFLNKLEKFMGYDDMKKVQPPMYSLEQIKNLILNRNLSPLAIMAYDWELFTALLYFERYKKVYLKMLLRSSKIS